MRNPLFKRLGRELKQDMGKFIALLLFMTLTIGLVSAMIVADGSMKKTYDDSFEKYNIEDGHFVLAEKADKATLEKIEQEGVKLYPLFYKDREISKVGSKSAHKNTIRIFKNRESINRVCLMAGELPSKRMEIAIDRLFAENNHIEVGEELLIDDLKFKVTGTVALSDYSGLFKSNRDMMLDANKFAVSVVTSETFEKVKDVNMKYAYGWKNLTSVKDDNERNEFSEKFKDSMVEYARLTDFVPREVNQAIIFSGNDLGKDKVMMEFLLYIIMVVLAFAFSVTLRSTVEKEASSIGTLRAMGYRKLEIINHYLAPFVLVLILAGILGNVLGYTFLKETVVKLYYHSYSLPKYVTIWSTEAFLKTTLIPSIILWVISLLILFRLLSLSPLKFIRNDLNRSGNKRALGLNFGSIMLRFKLRIIGGNKGTYLALFLGIFFASIMLLFGTMFVPLLSHFKSEVTNSQLAKYQYVLKAPIETAVDGAEKYSATKLQFDKNDLEEEITIYGINDNSEYVHIRKLDRFKSGNSVLISDGYMEKFGIKVGDELTLKEEFGSKSYKFRVLGTHKYPATLSIFMERQQFNRIFEQKEDYFTGYFSNREIKDIDEMYIATKITLEDLVTIANQLEDSMGDIFYIFWVFSALLFMLVMYVLSKNVIEKNSKRISMIKILGYTNIEVSKLYNRATALVVVFSLLISIPLGEKVTDMIYHKMMLIIPGWLTYYMAPKNYLLVFAIGIACYGLVHILESHKISKIPLSQALKDAD